MNEKQATEEVRSHLSGVTIKPYDQTLSFLKRYFSILSFQKKMKIFKKYFSLTTKTLCSGNSPSAIVHACADREVITDTPVGILKSIKNDTEIKV